MIKHLAFGKTRKRAIPTTKDIVRSRLREGEWRIYKINVPEETPQLSVTLEGQHKDNLDLLLYPPEAETTKEWKRRPVSKISLKGAIVKHPEPGEWKIAIYGTRVTKTARAKMTIDLSGKEFVKKAYTVNFDEKWAEANSPLLYIKPDELMYWKNHRKHRPSWYHRNVFHHREKRFCAQFLAHWPDQFDWIWPSRHRWDYEPIFVYFDYRGVDDWSSIKENSDLRYIYYDHQHWSAKKLHPPLLSEENHPLFVLKSGYHAYDPMRPLITPAGRADARDLEVFQPRKSLKPLANEIIVEWRSRQENPFKMWEDFKDPWKDGEGPGSRFD